MRFANKPETAKQKIVDVQGSLADCVRPILFLECDIVLPSIIQFMVVETSRQKEIYAFPVFVAIG
jgi:hypothetical protein